MRVFCWCCRGLWPLLLLLLLLVCPDVVQGEEEISVSEHQCTVKTSFQDADDPSSCLPLFAPSFTSEPIATVCLTYLPQEGALAVQVQAKEDYTLKATQFWAGLDPTQMPTTGRTRTPDYADFEEVSKAATRLSFHYKLNQPACAQEDFLLSVSMRTFVAKGMKGQRVVSRLSLSPYSPYLVQASVACTCPTHITTAKHLQAPEAKQRSLYELTYTNSAASSEITQLESFVESYSTNSTDEEDDHRDPDDNGNNTIISPAPTPYDDEEDRALDDTPSPTYWNGNNTDRGLDDTPAPTVSPAPSISPAPSPLSYFNSTDQDEEEDRDLDDSGNTTTSPDDTTYYSTDTLAPTISPAPTTYDDRELDDTPPPSPLSNQDEDEEEEEDTTYYPPDTDTPTTSPAPTISPAPSTLSYSNSTTDDDRDLDDFLNVNSTSPPENTTSNLEEADAGWEDEEEDEDYSSTTTDVSNNGMCLVDDGHSVNGDSLCYDLQTNHDGSIIGGQVCVEMLDSSLMVTVSASTDYSLFDSELWLGFDDEGISMVPIAADLSAVDYGSFPYFNFATGGEDQAQFTIDLTSYCQGTNGVLTHNEHEVTMVCHSLIEALDEDGNPDESQSEYVYGFKNDGLDFVTAWFGWVDFTFECECSDETSGRRLRQLRGGRLRHLRGGPAASR